jgi:hypothetical protein
MRVSGQRHAPARLTSGNRPPVPLYTRLVWTQRLEEKFFASAGDQTAVVQFVVRHYTDWATQAPKALHFLKEK